MYVNMFNDLEKAKEDNPTIGIILCTDKDNTVVKYSSIDNEKLFVSKYQLYLPTEEELKAEIEEIFESAASIYEGYFGLQRERFIDE